MDKNYKKKNYKVYVVLTILTIVLFCSCSIKSGEGIQSANSAMELSESAQSINQQSESYIESQISETERLDITITSEQQAEYDQRYLVDLYCSAGCLNGVTMPDGTTTGTWTSANEIRSTALIKFFQYSMDSKLWVENADEIKGDFAVYSADRVETFIMNYFDVTVEHLRTADQYDDTSESYLLHLDATFGNVASIARVEEVDGYIFIYITGGVNDFVLKILPRENGFQYYSEEQITFF